MINIISSKNNQKIVHASKLQNKKYIDEYHEFLIEGKKVLEMAIKENLVKEVFTIKEMRLPYNIPQYLVSEEIIKKISNNVNPEGVVAICQTLDNKAPEKMDKVVYLDNIQDPGNMGTLIRTALAFNYDALILSKGSVSIYNPKVIASSKGAIFSLPIIEGDLLDYKKDHVIIASSLNDQSIELDELKKIDRFILVLGNEGHGISSIVEKNSDIFVKIPISNIDSLNVAVAGGILMNYLK